jgi:hypothetical protein
MIISQFDHEQDITKRKEVGHFIFSNVKTVNNILLSPH